MNAPGGEERQLMPRGSLTDILWENWSSLAKFNTSSTRRAGIRVAVRPRNDTSKKSGLTTHGKDGDWVVSGVYQFSSFDTDLRIGVAYCRYQLLEAEWQELRREKPVDDLLKMVINSQFY